MKNQMRKGLTSRQSFCRIQEINNHWLRMIYLNCVLINATEAFVAYSTYVAEAFFMEE
tara:strand:+ start:2871 stop:3044 length:174 start_codon:yes stop_codon:yes gene_type:complete